MKWVKNIKSYENVSKIVMIKDHVFITLKNYK